MDYTHYVHFFDGHSHEQQPFDSYEEAKNWIDASAKREQERSDRFREEGFAGEPSQRVWAIQKIGENEIEIIKNDGDSLDLVEIYVRQCKRWEHKELTIVDHSHRSEHEVHGEKNIR